MEAFSANEGPNVSEAPTFPKANRVKLALVYAILLAWLGGFGWVIAWPPNWLTIPVTICYFYAAYRFIAELTIYRNRVPTLATCYIARQKIAELIAHEYGTRDKSKPFNIVDLGSGRGELARCIAKKIPEAQVLGIETARFPFLESKLIQRLLGPKNLSFSRTDFWTFDCSNLDVIVMYLGPETSRRVGEKLAKELRPGSIIISHDYPLSGPWTPEDTITIWTPFKEELFVYRK